jgi:hypothetical protein
VRKFRMLALGGIIAGAAATVALAAPGASTGPSSSAAPYLVRTQPGIVTTSILTTGDTVGGYKMAGIPDGLGAFDNGDGTFTVLMNHEIPTPSGVAHTHNASLGAAGNGAFVSRWVVDSQTLQVLSGEDLIKSVYRWNGTTSQFEPMTGTALNFSRFCSADLADPSAFFDAASGKGSTARIYMNGEETGTEGRNFAHVVTGPDAGKSYELPWLGKFAPENTLAKPGYGVKTAVAGLDDGAGGNVYFYIGAKQSTGNEVQKAGLTGGGLWGLKIDGVPAETNSTGGPGTSHHFSLVPLGDVSALTGAQLNALNGPNGLTAMNRPEDGSWDPTDAANFYFNTTAAFNSISRLWKLEFDDPSDITKGGTATVQVASPEFDASKSDANQAGPRMLDNLTVNDRGQIVDLEDVGNNSYIGGVYQFDPSTGGLARIAEHDPNLFADGGSSFITHDEESSGVILAPFLGEGKYLIDVQNHKLSGDPTTVEGGQLLVLHIPPGKKIG